MKRKPFVIEVGSIIKGRDYAYAPVIKVTAIGEDKFLAIDLENKKENMYLKNASYRDALPDEIERCERKRKIPTYLDKRNEKVVFIW